MFTHVYACARGFVLKKHVFLKSNLFFDRHVQTHSDKNNPDFQKYV